MIAKTPRSSLSFLSFFLVSMYRLSGSRGSTTTCATIGLATTFGAGCSCHRRLAFGGVITPHQHFTLRARRISDRTIVGNPTNERREATLVPNLGLTKLGCRSTSRDSAIVMLSTSSSSNSNYPIPQPPSGDPYLYFIREYGDNMYNNMGTNPRLIAAGGPMPPSDLPVELLQSNTRLRWSDFSEQSLRDELKSRGLSGMGSKIELVRRLEEDDELSMMDDDMSPSFRQGRVLARRLQDWISTFLFTTEIQRGVPRKVIQGAALGAATLGALYGKDITTASVVGLSAAYVAILPGSASDVIRAFGEATYDAANTTVGILQQMELDRQVEQVIAKLSAPDLVNLGKSLEGVNAMWAQGLGTKSMRVTLALQQSKDRVMLQRRQQQELLARALLLARIKYEKTARVIRAVKEEARKQKAVSDALLREKLAQLTKLELEAREASKRAQLAEQAMIDEQKARLAQEKVWEAEDRKLRNLEEKARAAEEKAKRAEELRLLEVKEKSRLEQEARLAEERARFAAEERNRIVAEEASKRMKAEEDARLAAEEAARLRKAEEQARLAAAEEAARLKKAEEPARLATEEATRLQKAEEMARLAAAEEAARRKEAEEQARLAAEEATRRMKANEEARRAAEEEAFVRRQAEEQARLAAQNEVVRRMEAEEQARLLIAEQEETRRQKSADDANLDAARRIADEVSTKPATDITRNDDLGDDNVVSDDFLYFGDDDADNEYDFSEEDWEASIRVAQKSIDGKIAGLQGFVAQDNSKEKAAKEDFNAKSLREPGATEDGVDDDSLDLEALALAARLAVESFEKDLQKKQDETSTMKDSWSAGMEVPLEVYKSNEAPAGKDWSRLTVSELRIELKDRGLSTAGKKAELVDRLVQAASVEEVLLAGDRDPVEVVNEEMEESKRKGEWIDDDMNGEDDPTVNWFELSTAELKDELERRGLPTSGRKADLIALLNWSDAELRRIPDFDGDDADDESDMFASLDYASMSLSELREEARERGLSPKGTKDQLVASLEEYDNLDLVLEDDEIMDATDLFATLDFASMSIAELRNEAKERGLSTKGTKDKLIASLEEYDRAYLDLDDDDDDDDDDGMDVDFGSDLEESGVSSSDSWASVPASSDLPGGGVIQKSSRQDNNVIMPSNDDASISDWVEDDEKTGPDYYRMTVAELKEELRTRGLSLSGKKADLISRLQGS